MVSKPPRKPYWLTADQWRDLWQLHGGAPVCFDCGTADRLSIDHIRARKFDGTHDLSNLCFRCLHHNDVKGTKPDDYWARQFYFDQVPQASALRGLQQRAWEALACDAEMADWFGQPASVIAGKLYLLAGIVGSGKTLAIPALACAYNQLQRRNWSATRRADRILVLTKEQAIRDQIAADLRRDLAGFGILPYPPRVAVLERYDQLADERWLSQQDVVVSCVHMFWSRKGGPPSQDLVEKLGSFPLIFVDEPHYGADQVRELLDSTPRSVVFGLTGSPIRRNMSRLRDFVLIAQYTYADADERDGSLKYLADDPDIREQFVSCVRLDWGLLMSSGQPKEIRDSADPDYDQHSLITAGQVALGVIRHLERCDAALPGEPAPHRDPGRVIADLLYPAHAIIRCESRALADMLCKQLQAYFEGARRRYPAERGWNVRSIFVGDGDLPGDRLDPEKHPWMLTWRKGVDPDTVSFVPDRRSARILIVVGMAREGVSNPLCAVTAQVDGKGSAILIVQGLLGRGLRAVRYIDRNGLLHVPPAPLDTVRVFYHETHTKTAAAVEDGIRFVMNMDDYFGELTTIGQLISGEAVRVEPDRSTADDPLTPAERVGIAVEAFDGEGDDWRSDDAAVERIIKCAIEAHGHGNENREERISQWIQGPLRHNPEETLASTGHIADLEDVPVHAIVLDEREKADIGSEELREFIRWNKPQYAPFVDGADDKMLFVFRGYYEDWIADRLMPQPQATDTLEGIRRTFTKEIKEFLRPWVDGDWRAFERTAHRYIGLAVRRTVGAPDGDVVGKDTKWDCPQVHVLLQRPDVRRAIQGYARAQLIFDGFCPAIARAMGIEADG